MGFRHSSPLFVVEKTGSISFGDSFVADRSLVPRPAAGITAFVSNGRSTGWDGYSRILGTSR